MLVGRVNVPFMTPEAYKARWQPTGLPQVVLFVALEEEKNELDHRTRMAFVHIYFTFADLSLLKWSEPEMNFNLSPKVGDHVTVLMMFS